MQNNTALQRSAVDANGACVDFVPQHLYFVPLALINITISQFLHVAQMWNTVPTPVGTFRRCQCNMYWAALMGWIGLAYIIPVYSFGAWTALSCALTFQIVGSGCATYNIVINHVFEGAHTAVESYGKSFAKMQCASAANHSAGSMLAAFLSGGLNHQVTVAELDFLIDYRFQPTRGRIFHSTRSFVFRAYTCACVFAVVGASLISIVGCSSLPAHLREDRSRLQEAQGQVHRHVVPRARSIYAQNTVRLWGVRRICSFAWPRRLSRANEPLRPCVWPRDRGD
eukprot:SAG31_NODE_2835_length_5019_cov_2.618293_2_plen_283_part_00